MKPVNQVEQTAASECFMASTIPTMEYGRAIRIFCSAADLSSLWSLSSGRIRPTYIKMSHPKCAKRVVIGDYNSICQMFLCIERLVKSEKSEKLT